MANIKLPTLSTAKPAATTQSGAAVYGAGIPAQVEGVNTHNHSTTDINAAAPSDAADTTSPAPYAIHLASTEDAAAMGIKPAPSKEEMAAMQRGEVVQAMPRRQLDDVVTLPIANVAKLEDLSRTMLEIRGEVAEAMRLVNLAASRDALFNTSNSLSAAIELIKADVKALRVDDNGLAEMIRTDADSFKHRLSQIDSTLTTIAAKHGVVHTTATASPTLHLRPVRQLTHKAAQDGATIVLCYNPRQGTHGNDEQEFTLRDQARPVYTGYCVDVPPGYVCDVFVGAEAVASLQGKGTGELVVNMRSSRGSAVYGGFVGAGREICRLALRKMEAVKLEIGALG